MVPWGARQIAAWFYGGVDSFDALVQECGFKRVVEALCSPAVMALLPGWRPPHQLGSEWGKKLAAVPHEDDD